MIRKMKTIILLMIIIATISLSSCSFDDTGNVYNHLNNEDPTKIHSDEKIAPEEQEIPTTGDLHCLGQYTEDDITNRDYELRAKTENDINLCYKMNDKPLIIECPEVATITYYSKERCLAQFN